LESFNVDRVAHHPDFQLFKPLFPPRFVRSHPLAILRGVWDVNYKEGEVIAKQRFIMPPMPFNCLSVERQGIKLCDDLVDSFTSNSAGTSFPSLNRTGSSTS
jgi:hypothetical protein